MWQSGRMMKSKNFYVVAYDISDTKRRNKVVKLLHKYGIRVNLSVFECMLSVSQYDELCQKLERLIVPTDDQVNIYFICRDCFAKIQYIPNIPRKKVEKTVVV